MQAHIEASDPAPGMAIAYVIRDAHKWEVDPLRSSMLCTVEVCWRRLGGGRRRCSSITRGSFHGGLR